MSEYMFPAEAAEVLHISRGTISRCKQMGAPVRYLGTCGSRYLINPDEWFEWMQQQGEKANQKQARKPTINIEELRAARHASVGRKQA